MTSSDFLGTGLIVLGCGVVMLVLARFFHGRLNLLRHERMQPQVHDQAMRNLAGVRLMALIFGIVFTGVGVFYIAGALFKLWG